MIRIRRAQQKPLVMLAVMALVVGGGHLVSRLDTASGGAVSAKQPGLHKSEPTSQHIGVPPPGPSGVHQRTRGGGPKGPLVRSLPSSSGHWPEWYYEPDVASEPYFPDGVFGRRKDGPVNDFTAKWYSRHLRAMGEPSLWELSRDDGGATGYRFLWLPTEGRPVAVRIMQTPERAVLHLVQLDGHGGYAPGEVAVDKEVLLSPAQWEGLSANFSAAKFWEMPTRDGRAGLDGEQLIVEGVRRGEYHIVDRWSPETGDFRRLCRHMLDLSGLDVGPSWYETRHVAPSLGRFAVMLSSQVPLSGPVAIALRFVRHTAEDDGGSVYEWAMQEDGSADFTRANVKSGRGEVYENNRGTMPGDRRGQPEIHCGPLTVLWSPFGTDADCLYFLSPRPRAISITATEWTDLKAIDVHSPKLTWYHLAETR